MTIQEFIEEAKRDYMRNPQEWKEDTGEDWVSAFIGKNPVIVSRRDLNVVSKYRWYMKSGYAVTSIAGKRVKMHHMCFDRIPPGLEVDHINRDRLDNRRENLRLATRQQNAKNIAAGKGYRRKGSGYEAHIQSDRKWISLGIFPTEQEASDAYLQAKAKYHAR